MDRNLEGEIVKSLDRLKYFAYKNNPLDAISPFYHAAQTLLRYGQSQKNTLKKQSYFQQFYIEFQMFARSDFSKLKRHHQKILDEIAQIIESQTFIQCLRPDLHNIRHLKNNLKIHKIETSNTAKEQSLGESRNSRLTPIKKTIIQIQTKSGTIGSLSQKQPDSLDDLYKSIKLSYEQHCLDDAHEKMQQYLSLIKNTKDISQQKNVLLKNISQQYETMINFYAQFDKDQWIIDKEQNGIKLQYKIDQVENMIAIRIHGQGDIPIQPFLAIISQIDLMGQYVPFCYDSKQIMKISRNERIGTTKIYIPLLKDRQTYFYASGYDRIKSNKSLFFFSKTINEDKIYQKKYNFPIPAADKYIRLEYKFFIMEYIPISSKRAKIRLASKIDMKMDFVPKFILFKSARIFAFDYFQNIITRIRDFKGSAWEQKVKQNPELYKFFNKKIDQYIFQ